MSDLVQEHVVNVKRQTSNVTCIVHEAGALENAVKMAAKLAQPGDVVLLSPGGTSFDAFQDFAGRGAKFVEYVNRLE